MYVCMYTYFDQYRLCVYACMCVGMYVCLSTQNRMWVRLCTYTLTICIHVYICQDIRTFMYIHTHNMYTCIYLLRYIHAGLCISVLICMYVCVCVYIYKYIYIYIYIYIHTQATCSHFVGGDSAAAPSVLSCLICALISYIHTYIHKLPAAIS